MASEKKTITKTFSRVKNHLAELQRWWPAHIKNDGRHGISVDPVLFRTDYSTDPTVDDEARVAGIRVEAIADDGSDVTGTEPTIVISGSGTFDPRCTINHADGTSTIIHLIAPTGEGQTLSYRRINDDGNNVAAADFDMARNDELGRGATERRGPYPVFMTVQELADLLDTWRHVGDADSAKKAWLPHGLKGTATTPAIDADPRSTSDALPTTSPYRATVFMPMMLDNNQMSMDSGSSAINSFSGGSQAGDSHAPWAKNGIQRFNQQPGATDNDGTVHYKRAGNSGDHFRSLSTASTDTDTIKAIYTSLDSSEAPPPHYRMAMALACFLKDGTYSLNDGAFIPYVFDATRTIGGTTTDTLYQTWDGEEGFGTTTIHDASPAGLYPFFDFAQGPLANPAQGTNWTQAVIERHGAAGTYTWTQAVHALAYETPPPIRPHELLGVGVVQGSGETRIFLYAEDDGTTFADGSPIYVSGISAGVGDGTETMSNGDLWGTRYDTRRSVGDKPFTGWWTVTSSTSATLVDTLGFYADAVAAGYVSGTALTRYDIHVPAHEFSASITETWPGSSAYLYRGRAGGPENSFPSKRFLGDSVSDNSGATRAETASSVSEQNIDGIPNGYTGFRAGMGQGATNVPIVGSYDDTYPGRPTLGEKARPLSTGTYTVNRPVPRAINIQTIGTAERTISSAPAVITKGDGSMRVPAPLGHDLCVRYNCLSTTTNVSTLRGTVGTLQNGETSIWTVRSDLKDHRGGDSVYQTTNFNDFWASRGLSTPLWSFIDGNTGRHAWDYVKPRDVAGTGTWTYGRNRPWPAHERLGTRLAMSPSLHPDAPAGSPYWSNLSGDYVTPGQETTRIGLSEIGCSPIHLDMEMTAFLPSQGNRMTIIEFDGNEAHPEYGRHHGITESDFGFVPLWDGIENAGVYRVGPFVDISGTTVAVTGATYQAQFEDALDSAAVAGGNPNVVRFPSAVQDAWPGQSGGSTYGSENPPSVVNNRPAVWFTPGAGHFTSTDWVGTDGLTLPGIGGFGRLGTGFGNGPAFSYSEGTNVLRTTFTAGGMTLTFNGSEVGTDVQARGPVWGMSVKACNAFAMTDRRPLFIGGTTKVLSAFSHLTSEELLVVGRDGGSNFSASQMPMDGEFYSDGGTSADPDEYFLMTMPVDPSTLLDSAGRMTRHDNPALQVSNVDLQIDEVVMRQVPTPAMLPFTVDTVKQVVTGATVARYTSLSIEADNISTTKGMKVTVTLLEPPTVSTIDQEASTVISGYDDLDPEFIGGVGAIDLTGLPASVVTSGFVIRFNFYVPSTEETDLHPVDWSKTPIVRSWTLYYDHKPTSELAVIGNTYDGSLADTATADYAFNAKVGHIVSVRVTGNTTDADRKIAFVKVDFGDGTITDWLAVPVQDTTVTYDLSHVYSERPAGGTYTLKAYVRDDSENESAASTNITATIVAAEPVAVLRAVPSMVRAGQAIRFDGSDSYAIDTGATLSTFTFGFGDGSTSVSGSALYQDHTYAQAGEFMATLTVNDGTSDSPTAKAVVKVLPATLVVPLTLSTKPSAFRRNRTSALSATPILDAVYPEVTDTGQRSDTFTLTGMFLKETMATDLAFMEELLLSGSLVEFEYQAVNFEGVADSKVFVGRMTSFDYDRQGGQRDRTPYTATFIREAGLGA